MSGVVGRSHCISTIGGTGLVSLELRGGPGQTVSESEGSCLRAQALAWFVQCAASISCSIHMMINISMLLYKDLIETFIYSYRLTHTWQ